MVSDLIHNVRGTAAGLLGASGHLIWYLNHRTGGLLTARDRADAGFAPATRRAA